MVIGLTGGIGCGKSTAAACFAELGFVVIDADRLARQVLESHVCVSHLRERWGVACLDAQGVPDRKWIGAKVFADPAERAFLESVTHPEVARLRREATADPRHDYVVEIPLLFEKELAADFDTVAVVACSDDVRRARLRSRGLSDDEISARIVSQLSLVEKVKRANVVFWNDGEPAFLREQVSRWVGRLRAE
jgi:dephospho-CoA kinase